MIASSDAMYSGTCSVKFFLTFCRASSVLAVLSEIHICNSSGICALVAYTLFFHVNPQQVGAV